MRPGRRAPVCAGADDRCRGRGVLPQDRLLEGNDVSARVDVELAREDRSEPSDRAECLTLRADAVLSQSEQLPAAFAQWGRIHHLVRPRQEFGGAAALELGVEQHLLGVQAEFVQASGLAARGRPLRELLEGFAPPELESLLQHERGPVGLSELQQLTPTRDLQLEPAGVELVEGDGEAVPVRRRLDGPGPQCLAESDHARLEVLGGGSRRMVAPHSVDQFVRAHWLPQPGDQRLEYDAVAGAETCEAVHGQRTEDCDPHATTVLPQWVRVNRADTQRIPLMSQTCTGAERTGWVVDRHRERRSSCSPTPFSGSAPTGRGPGRCAARLALAGTIALASVALLVTGPAQARIETPPDTGGRAVPDTASGTAPGAAAVPAKVSPTRVAGLYGIHVDGGWLLR